MLDLLIAIAQKTFVLWAPLLTIATIYFATESNILEDNDKENDNDSP